jgi:thiamine-phosphate pyrophosphorylase
MKLHAIVADFQAAVIAVEGGATVVQLRLKGATTEEVVEVGRPFRGLPTVFVVNDDVDAALELRADGVHLGRTDPGAERAIEHGLMLGTSSSSVEEAVAAERLGAVYVGAGPIWPTPTKPDADPPIGLDGLAEICEAVSIPVIAIGGVDATNVGQCLAAGASGVAVVRATSNLRAVNEALGGR